MGEERCIKNTPEDLENLVNLRITREEWGSLHDHLSHNATNGPHVDRRGVVPGTQQDLRSAVPQRYDLNFPFQRPLAPFIPNEQRVTTAHLMRIRPKWDTERPR